MNFYNEYTEAVRAMDGGFENMSLCRVDDPSSSFYGKCVTFEMLGEMTDLAMTASAARYYSCPESKYYHSDAALDMIMTYGKAGIEKFHEDSTCDLLVSNFRTADQFGLKNVAEGALIMRGALCGKNGEKEAYEMMREIVRRFAEGCVNGGFHTPNHRWVESAGLLMAYDLLRGEEGAERYLEKANKYLAEGVDCDEYGEWSERSAGMYNRHCDEAFLMIYEETKKPEYLDAVCRNLELMTHYFNDDFSIFSQNSRRKDKGEVGSAALFGKGQTYYAGIYVNSYLKAAYYSGNAKFYAMAKRIYDAEKARGRWNGLLVSPFLRNPELKNLEFDISGVEFEKTYEFYQPKSNIVRKKTDIATYSFLAKNPTFLQISAPGINVGVRMCASFFAVAQFIPDKLEKTDGGYMMSMTAHGEYKLPLEDPDESCRDYWSIDYSARGTVQPVDLTLCAEIKFIDGGVELGVRTSGCGNVPFKLEFAINEGLLCEVGNAAMMTKAGANVFSRSGDACLYSRAGTVMTVDGLFCKHIYAENMRGSLDPDRNAFTLYATDFTNLDKKITIKFKKATGAHVFY